MKKISYIEVRVAVIEEANLALIDYLTELSPGGVVEEWEWEKQKGGITAYFDLADARQKVRLLEIYLDSLRELWGRDAVIRYEVRDLVDDGWRTEYQRYFKVQRITPHITVAPPWEEYTAHDGEIVVRILPGPAFGTGTHETTRLCIEAIEEVVSGRRIASLLDVGCGSGILAIAGALLGIERVAGVESDPDAVDSARQNVERNGMDGRIEMNEGAFDRCMGEFDLVLANLTTREILPILGVLVQSVAPGGRLVLSGILDTEGPEMEKALAEHMPPVSCGNTVKRSGEWLCMTADRR